MSNHKLDSGKIPYLLLLLLSIFILPGSSGSANESTYTTYYAIDYNILKGAHLSGSVPASVQTVDSNYFIVRSSGSAVTILAYNPTGYNMLGGTTFVSGSVNLLTSNNGVYMKFRSYYSGTNIQEFVDNNASDVDSSTDKGTHSNFPSQQAGPDSMDDTLTEEYTVGWNTTLLDDGFEGADWDANWDDNGVTSWRRDNFPVHSGSYSAWAADNHEGYITTDDLNASGASAIYIEFWFRKDDTESTDYTLYYFNGSNYNLIDELDDNGADDIWIKYAHKVTDSQYFVSNFRIRLAATLDFYENVWLDDVLAKKEITADNYELDLEVQWTSVDFDETNEELCIYVGIKGTENIKVDVWYNSAWQNVFADLSSGWNNFSVSSYLTSSTFTIRFKGGIETADSTQDSWNIDATLLHVWSHEHTTEVEFTGSSNPYTWTQLEWAIDSAWTTGSVSVTLQLYNYSLGDYPASGNGYTSYTSSATANTDETKSQNITVNPAHFRNATGYWKMKVQGVKAVETQFDFEADWVKFEPTYWSEHTVSTEFLFLSMTLNAPTQLNFTVVSQHNITAVSVTIQVWNYSSSTYAMSGQAYLKYTSIGTDETKMLSINTNPQFYTSNGNAKIKITSVLSPPKQYQQETNQIKLVYSYGVVNSPPVLDTIGSKTADEQTLFTFTATASDPDGDPLTFSLDPGAPTGASITAGGVFTWTPTEDQGPGNYTIRVIVSDGSLTDYEDISVTVYEVRARALRPFDWATALLYMLPVLFGLLFFLTVKLKRKKKTDLFSESFGMTHQQMVGKKMLLEIDPTSDYHKALFSFASEAKNSGEPLFIFTSMNSALHSALRGAENVKFFILTSNTSSLQQINEKEILLPAHDLSVLLNASVEVIKVRKEKTTNTLFDNISSIIIRCGFKKTYSFMHFLLEAISSPKATALFVFNPAAHDPVISSSIRGLFKNQMAYTKRGPKVGTL